MGTIERQATGKQTLAIADCPCCGGTVHVSDCGYSSFNPGTIKCLGICKRQWSFGHVENQWDCGVQWNSRAIEIRRKLKLMSLLGVKSRGLSILISRDYHQEELENEAKKLLNSLEESVIGADKK